MSDQPFQAPSPEYLAQLLPQYDVEHFIAQGGMGSVYKGRQLSLDRDIAIKVLPHEMGESEEFRESFISEAKAMARLNHTNLLGVFDYGTVEGMPYIVMEYVDGGSLHQAAYNQAVEYSQAVAIVRGVCEGLAHAHENGIVHRDIKPSNILLTQKVEPKIADFGLARAADSDKPGLMMGTPGYTAPEVFQDPDQAGMLADIYSVGVILNQLLTGIDPAGSMEPPNQSSGSLRLDLIWRKATHIDPAQRYPSIVAMTADLDKWMAEKKKLDASAVPSTHQARKHPAYVPTSGGEEGFMGKLLIFGVIVVLLVVTFIILQDDEEEIKNVTTATHQTQTHITTTPKPDPIEPKKQVSQPSENYTPSFKREPNDISDNEKPETVVEVDDKPEPEPSDDLKPGDPILRERAISLIGDARKKRDKELSDNASALHFALRPLSAGAPSRVMEILEEVKKDIVDNRIPLIDDVHGLPEDMVSVFERSISKEGVINEKYRLDLTRIRDAYVTRLKGASDQTSDEALKKRLDAQADDAEDLGKWIAQLSPEPHWVVRRSSVGSEESFAGKWEIRIRDNTERWTADPNGSFEVAGEDWEGTWKIRADDTLELNRDGKKLYRLTRDDDGWSGTNSSDDSVTLRRGDW